MIIAARTEASAVSQRRVDERAHHLAAAGDDQQRDQGERDPEREHDLADDQRPGRVDADREDDQRRREGDRPSQRQRDPALG